MCVCADSGSWEKAATFPEWAQERVKHTHLAYSGCHSSSSANHASCSKWFQPSVRLLVERQQADQGCPVWGPRLSPRPQGPAEPLASPQSCLHTCCPQSRSAPGRKGGGLAILFHCFLCIRFCPWVFHRSSREISPQEKKGT